MAFLSPTIKSFISKRANPFSIFSTNSMVIIELDTMGNFFNASPTLASLDIISFNSPTRNRGIVVDNSDQVLFLAGTNTNYSSLGIQSIGNILVKLNPALNPIADISFSFTECANVRFSQRFLIVYCIVL